MSGMTRQEFLLLLYSLPFSQRDHDLFLKCGARRAILVFDHAANDVGWLAFNGKTFVIRLDEPNYATPQARQHVIDWVKTLPPKVRACLEMVQIGVEPDGHLKFAWGEDWGNEHLGPDGLTDLDRHRLNHMAMRQQLQALGVKTCSPGFRCRDQDTRFGPAPDHGPQPGLARWYMYLMEEYGRDAYNGAHLYTFDGTDYDVEHRGERLLNRFIMFSQRELLIDEVNIGDDKQTPEQSMAATLKLIEMARTMPGNRVIGAAPFVMNGTPNGQWPAHQLMNSDACYEQVQQWLAGG